MSNVINFCDFSQQFSFVFAVKTAKDYPKKIIRFG